MSSDSFDHELLQEKRELLKGMYPNMKIFWQSEEAGSLRLKYGPEFPSFWQDLETWQHIKLMQKLFLMICEKKENGETISENDVMKIEHSLTATTLLQNDSKSCDEQNESRDNPKDSVELKSEPTSRKRRNRWENTEEEQLPTTVGEATSIPANTNNTTSANSAEAGVSRKNRRSRWGGDALSGLVGAGAVQPITQEVIQQTMVLKIQLQQLNDRLLNVAQEAALLEQDPNRPPSPAPKYDKDGKRTNTREVRMREDLTKDRSKLIEELVKLNPLFQLPADVSKVKPTRKVYIPFREFPTYNFIGLIIGPRGNTQKKMEQETGCKISIRGKGSMKEGSKGRSSQSESAAEDDDLHVFITADNDESADAAAKMVEDLLKPIDDDKNDHKIKQLRELALINGTLRDEEFCPSCGEKGHRQFECPHRAKTFKAAGVKCSICGDLSHPTRDCPMKKDDPSSALALDSEYNSFIAELDGRGGSSRSGDGYGGSSNRVDANGEPVLYAPKKQQTVIHVTTVMTGMAPPPLLSTNAQTAVTTATPVIPSMPPANQVWNAYDPTAYGHMAQLPVATDPNYQSAYYGQANSVQMNAPMQQQMDYSQYGYNAYGYNMQYQQGAYAYPQSAHAWPQQPPPPVNPPPPPN